MAFWSELALEPKRKFRWFLYFAGLPQFVVTKVKKPSFKIGTKAHDFLNYKFNYPGKVTWDPITFSLVDPIQPDATHTFMEILKTAGYDMPNQFVTKASGTADGGGSINSITKKGLADSFGGQIQLVQLGTAAASAVGAQGAGTVANPNALVEVEKWLIWNPQITSVGFGDLDYASEDLINIDVGITYDFAELEAGTGGQSKFATGLSTENNFTGVPGTENT
tara:strand:- start:1140 stop:1805 length:666 start_codon:yes stop_codon:yes gene_type:complete